MYLKRRLVGTRYHKRRCGFLVTPRFTTTNIQLKMGNPDQDRVGNANTALDTSLIIQWQQISLRQNDCIILCLTGREYFCVYSFIFNFGLLKDYQLKSIDI